jgi:hypothetical protein
VGRLCPIDCATRRRSKVARRSVGKPYLRSEGFQQVQYSQSERVLLTPDTTVHLGPRTRLDHHVARSGEVFPRTPAVPCRPLSAFKGISCMCYGGSDARSAPIQPAAPFSASGSLAMLACTAVKPQPHSFQSARFFASQPYHGRRCQLRTSGAVQPCSRADAVGTVTSPMPFRVCPQQQYTSQQQTMPHMTSSDALPCCPHTTSHHFTLQVSTICLMMMLALAALATTASAADHMKAPTGMPLGWRRHAGGVAV